MGLNHSPAVITDGLVFSYDQSSIRSYTGPAIRNLANGIGFSSTGTATGYSSTGVVETVDIPELGPTTVFTNVIQNNFTSFTPNSANCCPSLHSWGGFPVTPSTLYTYGIVYRCDSGYTHPNYMYRYEFTANGGTYLTEGGVHSDVNRVALGGGWFYAWGTFTTQPTTNWIGGAHTFYYRYFNLTDRLSVAKVLVAAGNFSGVHPKYWPDQATTKTNSQAIVNLSGNNILTANSLTYNSNGTFSFNGTSDFISTDYVGTTGQFTHEVFLRPTNVTKDQMYIGFNNIAAHYVRIVGSQAFLSINTSAGQQTMSHPQILLNNTIYHIVSMYDGTRMKIYVNGVLQDGPVLNQLLTGWGISRIGRWLDSDQRSFVGEIFNMKAYNRALTDLEVQRNFAAIQGRYGI